MNLTDDLNQEPNRIFLRKILSQTFASLFYPQVLLFLFLPFLISIIIVGLLLVLTWGFWTGLLSEGLMFANPFWQTFLSSLPFILVHLFQALAPLLPILFFIALFALAFPLIVVLNLGITSFLASTYLVHFIAAKDFPELQKKGQGRWALGLWKTIRSSLFYLIFWVLTFPLWLIPLVQLILPIVLTAWLNRQICSFDALTDFADDNELKTLLQKTASQGYVLGLITAGFNYIPFALFFSPVLTMVAYIYLELENLKLHRQNQST